MMCEERLDKPFPNLLGKIPRGTDNDLKDIVEVTEKIDGSYFQFGWYNNEFRYRTKSMLDVQGIDKMFKPAIDFVMDKKDDFLPHHVYCCEYLRKPRHNKLNYLLIGELSPVLFLIDVFFNPDSGSIYSVKYSEELYLKYPIENIIRLPILSLDDLNAFGRSDYGDVREGIVVKNSKGERFKYVSDYFKEVVHVKINVPKKEVSDVYTAYINGLKCRTDKTIMRFNEGGQEVNKTLFGKIIGATVNDLLEEEQDNIANDLFKFYEKDFKKKCNKEIIDYLLQLEKKNEYED